MIVNVIEIFTEYLSVILCVHKIAKKKLIFDRCVVMFFILDLISILVAHIYREEYSWLMIIVYVNFFVYVKMRLSQRWTDAIKVFSMMLILIPSLQLIIYYAIKYIFTSAVSEQAKGMMVNCISCLLLIIWKKEYIFWVAKWLVKSRGVIIIFIFWFFFAFLLYSYKISEFVYKPVTLQSVAGIVGVGIISILWINAENEKKNKAKELKLYQLYNKTFEEAVLAIRARQHEFDNHINAIKCLQFTVDNPNDLVKAQNEYCDKVLNENSFNKLLKLHTEPILTGFLYSKFMNAKEQDIHIIHDVHSIKFQDIVEVNDIIEILGILFDNAIEALLDKSQSDRILIVKLLQEDKEKIIIEISNRSRKYLNNEIEKFCIYGYSTKGDNRGIGLARVKEIAKKYKANFYIGNVNYSGDNYLCFKIYFDKTRRN